MVPQGAGGSFCTRLAYRPLRGHERFTALNLHLSAPLDPGGFLMTITAMKWLACLLLASITAATGRAESFNLREHGRLNLYGLESWKITTEDNLGLGYNIMELVPARDIGRT